MSVSQIRALKDPVREDTVETLRGYLKRAEAGEVLSVMIVTLNKDRQISTFFSDDLDMAEAVFGLTCMRLRLEALIEGKVRE